MQILLSNSQAGPGRTVKQEQEEISRNHVQTFSGGPVQRGSSTQSQGFVTEVTGTDLRLCLTNQDGSSQDVNHAEADVGGYVDAGIGEAVILIQLISSSTCSLPVTVKNKFREATRSKCHHK